MEAEMNRRHFLSMFAKGIIFMPLAPVVAIALPQRRLIVQQSPVAGFQYYEGERLFGRMREGMPLQLVREPENRHDKNAVAVCFRNKKIGFVPRAENCAISSMMDRGEILSTRIMKLEQGKNPWGRIRFEVAIDG
jgi:hypothetical protein